MKVGIALRSTVFSSSAIAKLVPFLDRSGVDSVWFPSGGPGFDALEMSGISLGRSSRLRVGTGVIRPTDYDLGGLIGRVRALSEGWGGRFILGIGTGGGIGQSAIEGLVEIAHKIRSGYPEVEKPPIFFAALGPRMLRAAYLNAQGAILNFCSPDYVRRIKPSDPGGKGFTLACYIKLFFAKEDGVARRMLADEMKRYDSLPQYHAMFEAMRVSEPIRSLDPGSTVEVPRGILEISSANPSDGEVGQILGRFRRAGVDLPIVYPYVSGDDVYRAAVVERLASIAG